MEKYWLLYIQLHFIFNYSLFYSKNPFCERMAGRTLLNDHSLFQKSFCVVKCAGNAFHSRSFEEGLAGTCKRHHTRQKAFSGVNWCLSEVLASHLLTVYMTSLPTNPFRICPFWFRPNPPILMKSSWVVCQDEYWNINR